MAHSFSSTLASITHSSAVVEDKGSDYAMCIWQIISYVSISHQETFAIVCRHATDTENMRFPISIYERAKNRTELFRNRVSKTSTKV